MELCLMREHLVGVERLGAGKRVHARLMRIDRALLQVGMGAGRAQRVAEVGGRVLMSSRLNMTGVGLSQW